ncbi:MAG: nitronate monooxygenase [Lachnospiraceae bacterium]|nr:nitronate monooxygenase [Lachnospiraceae bacterium]
MEFKTRVTEILGIKYPIMCGGMQNVANPELGVAIAEAGGLGMTNMTMFPDINDFRNAVHWMRQKTDKPFAVNISMIDESANDKIKQYIDVCGEEGVNAIETNGRDPKQFIDQIHGYGMKIIHKVPMPRHALHVEKSGVDIVSIIGAEAAGHPSMNLISSSILVNKAAKLCTIPVIGGGGVCDGASFLSMLALGAEGVVIGTRFINATECKISDNHKQWIIDHQEMDTVICQRVIKNIIRAAHNDAADECLRLEAQEGCDLATLMPVISGQVGKAAYESGDTSKGIFTVGQDIGLIDDVKPAKQIIEDIIAEANAIMNKLNALQ